MNKDPKTISQVLEEFDETIIKHWHFPAGEFVNPEAFIKNTKFLIKSSLEAILMSMPIDEVLATGFECDDYNQGCNKKSKEVKEWRDNVLKQ